MKKLSEICNCNIDTKVSGISINSKEVKKNNLFVCIKGVNEDRHDHINEAVKKGCAALVVCKNDNYKVPYVIVDNPNKELGIISKKFYNNPTKKLKVIGVTGTDGKTTTTSIIRNMIGNDNCGYIGTNGVYIHDKKIKTNNTTLEINETYKYLNQFVKENLKYASLEISSEALFYDRTNTLELDIAIVTNITKDHLNIHKTINDYIESKKKIFNLLKPNGYAIINRDDENYNKIIEGVSCNIYTYGKNKKSNLIISNIKTYDSKTSFNIEYKNQKYKIITNLLGEYNVYNLSASILTLLLMNYDMETINNKIKNIEVVSGRGEFLDFKQNFKIILDYAHTPNALKNVLTYLKSIKKGKIITLTGSAGGRDKTKRKEMGEIVLKMSDYVIFTMDDPRFEKVDSIINDLVSDTKYKNYERINNRKKAIKKALSIAKENDIVLIAGKGRDSYMAINNKKIKYCDYNEIKNFFMSENGKD